VICHGIPDSRELQEGDICNIDVTGWLDGVHGDTNATFFVGDGMRVSCTTLGAVDAWRTEVDILGSRPK
jgi:methionine aminopeptidase